MNGNWAMHSEKLLFDYVVRSQLYRVTPYQNISISTDTKFRDVPVVSGIGDVAIRQRRSKDEPSRVFLPVSRRLSDPS
jgi:hypothetical protein